MNFRDFSILMLLFSTFCIHSQAEVVERVEAIVNKKAIYKSDVTLFKFLKPLRTKIDPIFSNDPISKKEVLTEIEIVNFLIDESMIAEKFPVQDAEVEQEINGIQGNLKIDRDSLKAAIQNEGFKFEDYFKLMRISLSKRQLLDHEIRNKAAVSEDDIMAEYNRQHSGSKSFRGSFHLFLMRFSKKNYKNPAEAKEIAKSALTALNKGESFEEVAKRLSDDSSQSSGGDLGFLSYSEMSSDLQKHVQKLGPGKTSDLVEDSKGFLILRVTEVKADGDSVFDREKDALRGKLMEGEFQHQIRLWLDRQRALNFVTINIKG